MQRKLFTAMTFLFLFSSTELHELAKLPRLISHYIHHRTENKGLSLISFLGLHYTANHPDDKDNSEDQELPFRNTTDMPCSDITAVVPFFTTVAVLFPLPNRCCAYFQEGIPDDMASSLFRPPRC